MTEFSSYEEQPQYHAIKIWSETLATCPFWDMVQSDWSDTTGQPKALVWLEKFSFTVQTVLGKALANKWHTMSRLFQERESVSTNRQGLPCPGYGMTPVPPCDWSHVWFYGLRDPDARDTNSILANAVCNTGTALRPRSLPHALCHTSKLYRPILPITFRVDFVLNHIMPCKLSVSGAIKASFCWQAHKSLLPLVSGHGAICIQFVPSPNTLKLGQDTNWPCRSQPLTIHHIYLSHSGLHHGGNIKLCSLPSIL